MAAVPVSERKWTVAGSELRSSSLEQTMVGIHGVLLDESVLVSEDNGNIHLTAGSEALLRRLRYSKLHLGISYSGDIASQKIAFVKSVALLYSCDCISIKPPHMSQAFDKILQSWNVVNGKCIYVIHNPASDLIHMLGDSSWVVILYDSPCATDNNPGGQFIYSIEEIPLAICRLNKMLLNDMLILTVGYVMKDSREQDFAKRGAFPMLTAAYGLMFVPISFGLPLAFQLQDVDVILHKATDDIIDIDPNSFFKSSGGICLSQGMQELQRCTEEHSDCCVVDPISNVLTLVDRLKIQKILYELESMNFRSHCRIRAPRFLQVNSFLETNLAERLSEAQLAFPNIVKPQVACGVADAHKMAVVFRMEDFRDLDILLPAIVQEYIDHGATIFKFYVLGRNVMYTSRSSIPNATFLASFVGEDGSKPITFDSLKSLPTKDLHNSGRGHVIDSVEQPSLDVDLATTAAHWLKRRLNLTIFGFDMMIQEGTGDHLITDLNYFPSFKEVPDDIAVPALWDALKDAYVARKG